MAEEIRVRFAPSPTGYLHVGGARTALFNWLFAKNKGAKFILRIEDTDRMRSTIEANKAIIEGLEWLGLEWDEGPGVGGEYGPYYQTERLPIYREAAEKLLAEGKAYYCFCTAEELEENRKLAAERKEAPKYDGRCRKLSEAEIEGQKVKQKDRVIRFKLPAVGETVVSDLIRGEVRFENDLLDDFVIIKSDGFPTYNFAAVVDDNLMKITHVIRGDDHLSNTPRQILLYEAFGFPLPKFAHLPMILGSDKARLSKRHGAVSVVAYSEMGYLPEAMVNYLARLGWSHGDQEVFTREELTEKFSLDKVGKTSAVFDIEKLNWLNGQYIRKALPERILDLAMPYLEKTYDTLPAMAKNKDGLDHLLKVIKCLQDRLIIIPDIVHLSQYFFTEEIEYEKKAAEKYFADPKVPSILTKLKERLQKIEPFTKKNIEKVFKGLAEEEGVKLGAIIHPTRVALTGRAESPGMYEVIEILGKDRVIKRLDKAIHFLVR
ncbi:MAG: glutamate--tRNA ligase [Candidatus Saganbacteria bacterium]|nr:glutamate--tRNA ligase [Candidatus Saganbacteria bacterium]